MKKETFVIDSNDINLWNKFLDQLPKEKKDIYYLANYANLYKNKFCEPKCFIYKTNDNIFFYPFIKRKILNTNYYDTVTPYGYGGPIVMSNNKDFISASINNFSNYAEENQIICEQIKFHPLLKNYKIFQEVKTHKVYIACKTVTIDCNLEIEFMLSNIYKKSNKEKIIKIKKKNAKISFYNDLETVMSFQKIYNENLKIILAEDKYCFESEYYNLIFKNLRENFFIANLDIDGEILASQLFIYGSVYGSTHLQATTVKGKKEGVTNLLKHNVIIKAKELGLKYINFGGGRSNDENDSLLNFKKSFSNILSEFYIGEKIHKKNIYEELTINKNKSIFFSYRKDNFIT